MRPITLSGFEGKFDANGDPWATFSNRDEAYKRAAILHAIGAGPIGRVLELGAGNGSNSVAIARRALRLDATEGTAAGTRLIVRALGDDPRARAAVLAVPACFPRPRYDVVLAAELLYYLTAREMAAVARDMTAALRPGGRLVLAHHRVDYPDFAQHAEHIHARFLRAGGCEWTRGTSVRTGRWRVESWSLRR